MCIEVWHKAIMKLSADATLHSTQTGSLHACGRWDERVSKLTLLCLEMSYVCESYTEMELPFLCGRGGRKKCDSDVTVIKVVVSSLSIEWMNGKWAGATLHLWRMPTLATPPPIQKTFHVKFLSTA